MDRTTVYRLLKRVQREGESAFTDGRHGHPVKLRGEILTFLLGYCQSHPSAPAQKCKTSSPSALVSQRASVN